MKRLEQELKQKAFELLIDKIDVDAFEKYLYQLVEKNEINSESLLFDLVDINYKKSNYKKYLLNLIKDKSGEDELLCYEIYALCLSLSTSINDKETLNLIDNLSKLNIKTDYVYDILMEFYMLNDRMESEWYYYNHLTDEEAITRAKDFSKKVILKFNLYKRTEDWNDFLNCVIKKEKREIKIEKPIVVTKKQDKSLLSKVLGFLKGIIGIR
ncbi:conserved protein of unknown function [Tenacibaculum sp. 190524A02b]|uniref:hypothetical protein n=1 Tax=Tenacibaculum vairaonense TaxID=3137860 RepID=UPI0032B152FE